MANGKNGKADRSKLEQEREDIRDLKDHLEEEYRKAEISEANYQELDQKYAKRLEEIEVLLNPGSERPKKEAATASPQEGEVSGEQAQSEEAEEEKEEKEEDEVKDKDEIQTSEEKKEEKVEAKAEDKPKKGGFFGFMKKKDGGEKEGKQTEQKPDEKKDGKKEDKKKDETEPDLGDLDPSSPEAIERLAKQMAAQSGADTSASQSEEQPAEQEESGAPKDIEIEKLKVMIDTVRESNKSLEDSIRNLAESIGEIRSMVFQEDASMKEESAKLEKMEDEITEVKPKEIEGKFREMTGKLEQESLIVEKLQKKSEDLADKVNKSYEMLKSIGGIENLINVNKDIQAKIGDMKEALKYTERLALKTEKIFIDLNREMQDIVILKARQETVEDSVKDILKNLDGINVKLSEIPNKKDLDVVREDVMTMQRHMDEINKVLPLVDAKMPEEITRLRAERNNIQLFLDSLEEHYKSRVLTSAEYEDAKRKNAAKLEAIERQLKDEWAKLQSVVGSMQKEQPPAEEGEQLPAAGQPEQQPAPEERKEAQAPSLQAAEHEKPAAEGEPADQEEKPKKKRVRKKKETQTEGQATSEQTAPPAVVPQAPEAPTPAQSQQPEKPAEPEKPVEVEQPMPQTPEAQFKPEEPRTQPQITQEQKEDRMKSDFLKEIAAKLQGEKAAQAQLKKAESSSNEGSTQAAQGENKTDDMSDVLRKVREKMR